MVNLLGGKCFIGGLRLRITEIGIDFMVIIEHKLKYKSSNKLVINIIDLPLGGSKQFPALIFGWFVITTLYHLMLQSWYQKTAQSLVNT